MKPIIFGLAAGVLATTAISASAQPVDHRAYNQELRPQQGDRNGSLTGREANRLQIGEARINRTEARMRSNNDGQLNYRQRGRLAHMEQTQSRTIYRLRQSHRYN